MKANNPTPAAHAPMYALTLMEYRGNSEMRCGEIDIPTDIFEAMEEKAIAADDEAFTALLERGLAEMTKPTDPCAFENRLFRNVPVFFHWVG